MRLDVNDPKVFDTWRTLYYDLTHEENIEFGNAMEAKYPHQASFDAATFSRVFDALPRAQRVVEVGGWKGELAQHLCAEHASKILSWTNIDMCRAAVLKTPTYPIPYTARFPARFDWFVEPRQIPYDVFVSAHTIEHLTGKHVLCLLDWLAGIPIVVLEAPITMSGQTWDGYQGTHILELGWTRIAAEMQARGYSPTQITDWCWIFRGRQK